MAEPQPSAARRSDDDQQVRAAGRLSRLLVALAVVMMVAGVGLGLMFGTGGAEPEPKISTDAGSPSGDPACAPAGFMPVEPPAGDGEPQPEMASSEAPSPAAEVWSPALFRLGFSFFIGFAVAYAVRSFVKLSLISAGFFAMALLGMQYAGFVEINWTLIGQQYESAGAWLGGQFDSFQAFVTGELPSAAGALGGLALGFKSR